MSRYSSLQPVRRVAGLVAAYLADAARLRRMAAAARRAGRPEATVRIAEGLARLVGVTQ